MQDKPRPFIVVRIGAGTMPTILAVVETRRKDGDDQVTIMHLEQLHNAGNFDAIDHRISEIKYQTLAEYPGGSNPETCVDITSEPGYKGPSDMFPTLYKVMTGTGDARLSDGTTVVHRIDILSAAKALLGRGTMTVAEFPDDAKVNDVLKEVQRKPNKIESNDLAALTETTNEDIALVIALAAYHGGKEYWPIEFSDIDSWTSNAKYFE